MRILFSFLLLFSFSFSQTTFVTKSNISFFSSAPLEDISAVSNKLEGVVDFSSGEFFFRIPIHTFIFPSSLMQKHFNEKYMESDIYSLSSFKGNFSLGFHQKSFISNSSDNPILLNNKIRKIMY